MNKQTEALKLALEALEYISSHYMSLPKIGCMALAAVEEALAQPEQETVLPGGGHVPAVPVAVYGYCPECGGAGVMRERRPNGDDKCTNGHKYPSSKALAEQPAQQQEPVSLDDISLVCLPHAYPGAAAFAKGWNSALATLAERGPLYASPPPRKPWVGLTDQEIRDWWRIENGLEDCQLSKLVDFTLAVRAIEAKLREKNA